MFIITNENTIFEVVDRNGKVSRKIADELYNAIYGIAEEFSIDNCDDVKMTMISPGCAAVLWLANGDPGYPAEPAEYAGECPHCGNTVTEGDGKCRCGNCHKFYKITYDEGEGDW
jgi:hypothetical protein